MKNDSLASLISSMHSKLNNLIEMYDYNLLSSEVLDYSRQLDRVLDDYIKSTLDSANELDSLGYVTVSPMASVYKRRAID